MPPPPRLSLLSESPEPSRNIDVGFENSPVSVSEALKPLGRRSHKAATVDKAKDPIFRSARRRDDSERGGRGLRCFFLSGGKMDDDLMMAGCQTEGGVMSSVDYTRHFPSFVTKATICSEWGTVRGRGRAVQL